MALWKYLRKYTSAAELRRDLGKPSTDGRTAPPDLVHLAGKYGLAAKRDSWSGSLIRAELKAYIGAGAAGAVLGTWIDPSILHWVLAIGYGNGAMLAMEPWNGNLRAWPWSVVQSLATGDAVRLGP